VNHCRNGVHRLQPFFPGSGRVNHRNDKGRLYEELAKIATGRLRGERATRIVKLRYLGGMSFVEIATLTGDSKKGFQCSNTRNRGRLPCFWLPSNKYPHPLPSLKRRQAIPNQDHHPKSCRSNLWNLSTTRAYLQQTARGLRLPSTNSALRGISGFLLWPEVT
jgi:hypothetical protein